MVCVPAERKGSERSNGSKSESRSAVVAEEVMERRFGCMVVDVEVVFMEGLRGLGCV